MKYYDCFVIMWLMTFFSSSTKDHTIKQKMLDSYNQTTTKMMEQNYQKAVYWHFFISATGDHLPIIVSSRGFKCWFLLLRGQ